MRRPPLRTVLAATASAFAFWATTLPPDSAEAAKPPKAAKSSGKARGPARKGKAPLRGGALAHSAVAPTTPGESAEMSAWMKAAAPNEHHGLLARFAGSFSVESRFYAGPDAEAQVSQGTAEHTMILGGRVLRQEFSGTTGGQSYQGLGLLGYDNTKGHYYSYWVDGMSTMPLTHEGDCRTPACDVIELRGEYLDPLSHRKKKTRTTNEVFPDGRLMFTLFDQDGRGREFKSLELVYTRK